MKKRILFFSLFILFISCQGQEKTKGEKINVQTKETVQNKSEMNSIDLKKIKEHIELQKRVFTADHTPDNEYLPTREDLDLQLPLIEKSLFNSGYKFPEYSEFRERIKEVFGIDLDKSKETIVTVYYYSPLFGRDTAYTDEEMVKQTNSKTFQEFAGFKYNFMEYEGWSIFINHQWYFWKI